MREKIIAEIPVFLCGVTLLKPIESVGEAVMLI
jgi:hypothetical protein